MRLKKEIPAERTRDVPNEVVAMVCEIGKKLRGWNEKDLFSRSGMFRFPNGPGWGLCCFLEVGARIENVTDQYVEYRNPGRKKSFRFYNPRVKHPWERKSEVLRLGPRLWKGKGED